MTYTPHYDFLIQGFVPDDSDKGRVINGYYGRVFCPTAKMWGPWGAYNASDISRLKLAGHTFYVEVDGNRAEVNVLWTNSGEPYLQSEADTVWWNNLHANPWSRMVSIAPPPTFLLNTIRYAILMESYRRQKLGPAASALAGA